MSNNNFRKATDVYYDRIKLKPTGRSRSDIPTWDPNSKYARASRLGLCFHCLREDTNPKHRPKHRSFGFCDECMAIMSVGIEGLELRKKLEIDEWFGDQH
jgi:hypothetical protein